jgi:hypothetical protein
METCWLPALDSAGIDVFVEAMATAVSPGSRRSSSSSTA